MTYSAVYCSLISKRLQNPITKKDCYCEKHHIIPASEGGDDSEDNLVNLTAREHYIAHLLLARIYDDYKMWNAIHWMSRMNEKHYTRITSRLYSTIKLQFSKKLSESQRGRTLSTGTKQKISEAMRGKPHSEEHSRKIGESQKGRTLSDEHKRKLSMSLIGANNPMYGLHWYTNGVRNIRTKTCPAGFKPGRI